jgi:hypothetical protein
LTRGSKQYNNEQAAANNANVFTIDPNREIWNEYGTAAANQAAASAGTHRPQDLPAVSRHWSLHQF